MVRTLRLTVPSSRRLWRLQALSCSTLPGKVLQKVCPSFVVLVSRSAHQRSTGRLLGRGCILPMSGADCFIIYDRRCCACVTISVMIFPSPTTFSSGFSLLSFGLRPSLPLGLRLCPFAYGPLSNFISILSFTYTSISRKEVRRPREGREGRKILKW
jgi:hypothetical protein